MFPHLQVFLSDNHYFLAFLVSAELEGMALGQLSCAVFLGNMQSYLFGQERAFPQQL